MKKLGKAFDEPQLVKFIAFYKENSAKEKIGHIEKIMVQFVGKFTGEKALIDKKDISTLKSELMSYSTETINKVIEECIFKEQQIEQLKKYIVALEGEIKTLKEKKYS